MIGVDVSDLIQSLEFFVDEPESTDELLVENLDTFDQAQVKIHNFLDVNLSIILVISLYSIAQTKIEVTSLFIICRDWNQLQIFESTVDVFDSFIIAR